MAGIETPNLLNINPDTMSTTLSSFDVLLTVHLSIILVHKYTMMYQSNTTNHYYVY